MMIVLAGLSGLVVGCLLTVCFFLVAKRGEENAREAQWRENQAQLQEEYEARLREQLQKQKALLLREQERRLREQERRFREQERRLRELCASLRAASPTQEKTAAAIAQPPAPTRGPEPQFEAVQSLKLEFRSAAPAPEVNPFFPGEGYLRDQDNRLIPRQEYFQDLNTGRGYAEQGIFWVFDAIYQGKCYSFAQLRTGALADRFFRLTAVVEPAVVEARSGYNIFYLKTKGKLEITDP